VGLGTSGGSRPLENVSGELQVSCGPKRILLVSSSGGVLLDLLALEPWWSRHDAVWAVARAADSVSALAGQRHIHWIREASVRQPLGILTGLVQAWRILRTERPELIVSAGSAPAIPYFFAARALGIPTFWISSLNILTTPGISARICARLTSRVLLQQPSMLGAHPNGIVIGELF
jgi:hypothetical protein